MAAVNMTVAARSRVTRFDYLDVGRVLLAADGLPDASLFRPDGLHMNPRGYMLWTQLVDAYLDEAVAAEPGPVSPSCHFPIDPRASSSEEHTSELQSLMR